MSRLGINNPNQALDQPGVLHIGETPYLDRSDWEFIAGGNGLTDTCNGDSGGPAYVTIGGVRYLAGATSRAAHDSRGDCGDRGIYTLVTAYIEWLEGESGASLGEPAPEPEPAPPEPEPAPPVPLPPEPEAPQPEPEAPQPEPDPPEEPEPYTPEPIPGLDPEPNAPDADGCLEVPDGHCEVFCARVDPDCFAGPAPDQRVEGPARLQGGCAATPGGADAVWWVAPLLLGLRRRRA